ncbi:hypothetical protein K0M31_017667 [Melipona bicolor]|uniref:Uncharacterized protein n=1 Tax=Melipona bicolor TaxID=60889 RepID=A0AA40KSR7_9HYME|nr:hypothetical protein K0M31_017667 [Melipona bicolor]
MRENHENGRLVHRAKVGMINLPSKIMVRVDLVSRGRLLPQHGLPNFKPANVVKDDVKIDDEKGRRGGQRREEQERDRQRDKGRKRGWSWMSRLCCPLRATPVNLALPDYRTNGLLLLLPPPEVELEERPNRVKLVSEVSLADRIGSSDLRHPNQPEPTSPPHPTPPPPWGSYVRGDLSIVSTSNLPGRGAD